MLLYDSANRRVDLGNELARGGQGVVLRVAGSPGILAKLYMPAPGDGQEDKLRWMTAHPPTDPVRVAGHASIAWPSDLLFGPQRQFVGYLMPYVQDGVPILQVFNPRSRSTTLPAFDRHYSHRAARNLAAALGALHEHDYVVGDLNESNVLVTPSSLVTLIDADSFQVQEPRQGRIIVYPCPVGKLEYMAPELQGAHFDASMRRWEHDAFALGVLVFQLLMEGNHPFRARWLGSGDPLPLEVRIKRGYFPYLSGSNAEGEPGMSMPVEPAPGVPPLDILHPQLVWMLRRCFVEGHMQASRRPAAREWEQALAEAEQNLVSCGRGHVFDSHATACPICGAPTHGTRRASHSDAGWAYQPGTRASRPPAGAPAAPAASSGTRTTRQTETSGGGPSPWPALLKVLWALAVAVARYQGVTGAPGSGPTVGSTAPPSSMRKRLWQWAVQRLANSASTGTKTSPAARVRVVATGSSVPVMPCARCGWKNHPDEIYCQRCAFPLAGTRACPNCGQPMPRNSRFCVHCQART